MIVEAVFSRLTRQEEGQRMKWFGVVVAVAILLIAGGYWYSASFSATARAEATAKDFMRFATAGDQVSLEALLAPESRPMASQIVSDYRGMTPGSFIGSRAMTNRSGVQVVVLVGLAKPSGTVGTTLLAMRQQDGRWVVTQVGEELSY
jgi:hypothetical protein